MILLRRLLLFLPLLLGFAMPGVAQYGYFNDISRLAFDRPIGTPRMQAMGGASMALGADLSALATNPAGLALFQSSSLVFAPALTLTSSTGAYQGQNTADSKLNINVGSVGGAFPINTSSWDITWLKGATFGIGLNRQADYQANVSWTGLSPGVADNQPIKNGLVHHYLDLAAAGGMDARIISADQLYPDQQQVRSAYSVYMLDVDDRGRFTTFIPPADYQQTMNLKSTGGRMSIDLGAGFNINDRIMVGFAGGIGVYNFSEERVYEEKFAKIYFDATKPIPNDATYRGASYKLSDKTTSNGTSFNFRIGAQALLTQHLRWGIAIQLPTIYNIYQGYETTLEANYFNTIQTSTRNGIRRDTVLPTNPARGPVLVPDIAYQVGTPAKYSTGLAYTDRKWGLISLDVDWIDYTKGSISSKEYNLSGDNAAVPIVYKQAFNIRAGTEIRYDQCRFRAGYAYLGSPVNQLENLGYYYTLGQQVYSVGFGLRSDGGFSFDISIAYNQNRSRYTAHSYTRSTEVSQSFINLQGGVTLLF